MENTTGRRPCRGTERIEKLSGICDSGGLAEGIKHGGGAGHGVREVTWGQYMSCELCGALMDCHGEMEAQLTKLTWRW